MAGNKVTLTFAGDAEQLDRTFSDVTDGASTMADRVKNSTKFDSAIEGFDTLDTRAMGFRDTITGVQDTTAGFALLAEGEWSDGLLTLGMGVGDLASGFVNLIVPLAQAAAAHGATVATMVAGWATTAASAVAGVAVQIGSWIALGVQSMISAAQVAAAWLLSIWPIALIIAAVVGLAYLIYRNWDTIKETIAAGWNWVKDASARIWNGIKAVVSAVWSALVSNVRTQINAIKAVFTGFKTAVTTIWNAVGRAISRPIELAVAAVKRVWNSTVGGKGLSIPGIPGIFDGASFTIPKLHTGGVYRAPAGMSEGLALLKDRETVLPPGQSATGPGAGVVIRFTDDGSAHGRYVLNLVREAVADLGGDFDRAVQFA